VSAQAWRGKSPTDGREVYPNASVQQADENLKALKKRANRRLAKQGDPMEISERNGRMKLRPFTSQ